MGTDCKLSEPETRERVEQALSLACTDLEKYSATEYIGYKIREVIDLEGVAMSQVIPEDLPKKNGVTILNYDLVADLNRIADDVDDEDTAMDLNFAAEAARTYVERLGAAEQRIDEDNVERNRIRAERDRLKEQLAEAAEQIKHHEDNERFSREIDLEPSQMTDDQLCADTEYSASCSCGLCRFVRHLLELRAKVAEQDALLKVLASAEAANRYADQMLTSADLDIAALQAKVAELEGKLAEFKPHDFMEWRAQVRRGALQEALNACCSICRDGRKHEGCPAQPILALIGGGA